MRNLIGLLSILLLTGCADGITSIPADVVEGAVVAAGYTKDASVAKEHEVHATLRHRDKQYAAAYATAGFKVKFKMQEVTPGVFVQVIEELAMKESPRFEQDLPVVPSVHPMWATLDKLGSAAIQWSGIGFLGRELAGVMNKGWDSTAPQYYGPYNPVTDSYNQTAEPFVVHVPEAAAAK